MCIRILHITPGEEKERRRRVKQTHGFRREVKRRVKQIIKQSVKHRMKLMTSEMKKIPLDLLYPQKARS
jgi:hypothetical protein